MLTDDQILAEFRAADALLEGHFILSSGLRSPKYLQCARVLMDPARAERLAQALAAKLPAEQRDAIDVVVSPAMGGVIIGHEMGRALRRSGGHSGGGKGDGPSNQSHFHPYPCL